MNGVEITALSVVCVVLYVAGAGVAFRLLGAPEATESRFLRGEGRWTCGCVSAYTCIPSCSEYCAAHARRYRALNIAYLWPLAGPWLLVTRPLRSVFRVCAGLEKRKDATE